LKLVFSHEYPMGPFTNLTMLQPYLEKNSKKDLRSIIKNFKDENPSTTSYNIQSWYN